jgi:hypothetical protein
MATRFLKPTNPRAGAPSFRAKGGVKAPKLGKSMGMPKMKMPKAVKFKSAKIKI